MARRLRYLAPSAILLAALVFRVSGSESFALLQLKVFDSLQRAHPRPYADARVRVVDVDDESLARLGPWPWPRAMLARLVDALARAGAKTVAFDVVFAEPDRASGDELFARAFKKTKVAAGFTLSSRPGARAPALKAGVTEAGARVPAFPGAVPNIPPLEAAAAGDGCFAVVGEPDGVVRRAPTLLRVGGTAYPSLALEALRLSQDASEVVAGRREVKVGGLTLPVDDAGRVWLHYAATAPARVVPAWKALDPKQDHAAFKDAIVLIGASAPGLGDLRPTPLSAAAPGVGIHAEVIEEALLGQLLRRHAWADGLELAFLAALGTLMILLLPRLGAAWCGAIALSSIAGTLALSWHAYVSRHLLLDPVYPSLCVLAIYATSSLITWARAEAERDRLLALDEAKDELVATVSHDLRGPVNSMVMIVDAMRQGLYGPLTGEQTEHLKLIEGMGRKLNGFVENVLDAAKIKAGKLALVKAEVDPARLIAELAEFFAPSALAKGVTLSSRAAAGLLISADREKLEQTLNNLIGNALKFTPSGGKIEIAAADSEGFVRFSVTDTGLGIAAEDLPRLFTRFEQAGVAEQKRRNISGAGLGLSICKAIVEGHGGRVWAESRQGAGSSFFFTIPRA